ncbi:peptidoglycan-binding protein [Streptomyces sp. NPDC050560]|uniref:peptidoglycan-binding domain-containing protein n=1 Tax=Streptomyces sp. NPDC050560 TaxID=3365630 RepID=UPI0037A141BD
MSAARCPECGTERTSTGFLACGCPERPEAPGAGSADGGSNGFDGAGDDKHPEEFESLRLRPYVPQWDHKTDVDAAPPLFGDEPDRAGTDDAAAGAEGGTAVLPSVAAEDGPSPASGTAAATAAMGAVGGTTSDAGDAGDTGGGIVPPEHGTGSAATPGDGDDVAHPDAAAVPPAPPRNVPEPGAFEPDEPPRRRRRTVVLAAVGAAAAVTVVALFAGGVFSYDKPGRDGALPGTGEQADGPGASVSPTAPDASRGPGESPSAPASKPGAPSTKPGAPGADASDPGASASAGDEPSDAASTAQATGSVGAPPDADDASSQSSVLALGAHGVEVEELQGRLRQVLVYLGSADGVYDDDVKDAVGRYQWLKGIKDDEKGVYGPHTRAVLEAETKKP